MMRSGIVSAIAGCLLLAGRPCLAQPGGDQSSVETTPQQDKAVEELELRTYPRIEVTDVRQVAELGCDGRDLLAAAPQSLTTGFYHVVLVRQAAETRGSAGLPAALRRSLLKYNSLDQKAVPDPSLRNFDFLASDYDAGPRALSFITVSKVAGRVTLMRDSEDGDRNESIQLIQDPPEAPDQPAGNGNDPETRVRMIVQVSGTDEAGTTLQTSAPSFMELRRRDAADVNRLIRPIVAEVGQEAQVFAVERRTAWQVLGGDAPVDTAMQTTVEGLLRDLDSDTFKERRVAQKKLDALGQPAAIALGRMDRTKLSPEVAGAVEDFLVPYRPLRDAEAQQLGAQADFLLDVLLCDDATLRGLGAARLSRTSHAAVPAAILDPATAAGERVALVDALRAKLVPTTQSTTQK